MYMVAENIIAHHYDAIPAFRWRWHGGSDEAAEAEDGPVARKE